ncbi:RdgB/HAM1 family non-canonical purine NTP pyrophosphatase [Pontibacter sp. G13]|uniref:RdgB/HAM1 family non-canonical purine NTP pyrophosphatase n=1 Tax=Pontibacter sp. G13 TaxID=3074898 RepID=UPI00288C0B33|nr:RdgB/HAM1 family non-canonical purine NTP pyrophosphatase [Pontibacter sp. G13]WNJ16937.1 RdgB/HAM1 family non-canonical purine NTP pyrophosphatase [Pontibacter sp. G13]
MRQQLLFGTNNAHKLEEIRAIVGDKYEVVGLADLGISLDVEETEPTLEGNAELKARAYFEASGVPCFSDDTGLEVEALGGAPGVYSARYAGPDCLYQDNVDKLLREMGGKSNRSAKFRTSIAFYDGQVLRIFEGEVLGKITETEAGKGGFGYDPVFLPDGESLTFAEMEPAAKHAISHRGRAVRKFADFLMQESL